MDRDDLMFRVWDTKRKQYVDKEEYCVGAKLTESGYVEVFYKALGETYLDDDSFTGRYIVERCTGCKDETGKLIYEGDHLLAGDHKSWGGVVTWGDGRFFILNDDGHMASFPNWEVCRIVGNVHDKETDKDEQGTDQ